MTPPVDIGREHVETMRRAIQDVVDRSDGQYTHVRVTTGVLLDVAAILASLRASLDAALVEKDAAQKQSDENYDEKEELEGQVEELVAERDAADATGYARGVRDAARVAGLVDQVAARNRILPAILALLPADAGATKKEMCDGE